MPARYGGRPVIDWSAAALMLLLVGSTAQPAAPATPLQFAQVTIREQIIVRVPVRRRQAAPAASSLVQWKESRGPRCVATKSIVGASLLGQSSVDLILRDNSRVRARLESNCPALDYYYGFYISPNADGKVCADRDTIRSRIGGQCEIERFRALSPVARR